MTASTPLIRRHRAFQDFFPQAEGMRAEIDAHFANPYEQTELTHGIWTYWYVPKIYNYFRADPAKVFPRHFDPFMAYIRAWARETLGLTAISPAALHLYLNGCGQGLHNDFHNELN